MPYVQHFIYLSINIIEDGQRDSRRGREYVSINSTTNPSTDDYAAHIREIINNLYVLIVQSYDYHGQNTAHGMTDEM